MRWIDADKLKEAFETDGFLSPYMERMIDACPTVNEWINVKDRLPEIGKEVLVCYDFGRMMVTALDGYWGTERLFWKYNNWITNPISVTHWMPLPEPPKEG